MNGLEVERLLQPTTQESPCGDDLEYDSAFFELEQAVNGKPERQMGEEVLPAEPPDWREVKRVGRLLLERTKDLRVGAYLARAELATAGFPGFRDTLSLVHGFIDKYWNDVHPRLDTEDENDPTHRINTLSSLCDADTTLRMMREVPLASAQGLGQCTLRDIEITNGSAPPDSEKEPLTKDAIDAMFTACDLEELKTCSESITASIELARAIEASTTEKAGVNNASSFEPLVRKLQEVSAVLRPHLIRRGAAETGGQEPEEGGAAKDSEATTQSGEINSREDVIRTLDRVCEYYERTEPSSPVPLLLQRAKRLASKSFLEIIEDLTPEGLKQAQSIGGIGERKDGKKK